MSWTFLSQFIQVLTILEKPLAGGLAVINNSLENSWLRILNPDLERVPPSQTQPQRGTRGSPDPEGFCAHGEPGGTSSQGASSASQQPWGNPNPSPGCRSPVPAGQENPGPARRSQAQPGPARPSLEDPGPARPSQATEFPGMQGLPRYSLSAGSAHSLYCSGVQKGASPAGTGQSHHRGMPWGPRDLPQSGHPGCPHLSCHRGLVLQELLGTAPNVALELKKVGFDDLRGFFQP